MLRIDIINQLKDTKETINPNNELVLFGINTDLDTIKQDLQDLKEIFKHIEDYKNKDYIKCFEADKSHIKRSIEYYKNTNFMYVNQKLVHITKEHITYSKKCITWLNKIIKELKKLDES